MTASIPPGEPQEPPLSRQPSLRPSNIPFPEPERPRRGPFFIIGGALLVAASFAAWSWRGSRQDLPEATASVEALAPETEQVAPEVVEAPHTTARELLDAAKRASAWNTDAVLAKIQARVVDSGTRGARVEGPLEVHYGKPLSGFGPGASLASERLVITYEGEGEVEQKTIKLTGGHIGLPEPNCPLEVAWRTATQAGLSREEPIDLEYALEQRQRRAVWRATSADGKSKRLIDAHSCAVVSP